MGKKNKKSEEGAGAGLAILFLLYLVVKFIWWILGALALAAGSYLVFYLVRALVQENRRRRDAYAKYCAAIVARADQQHNWVLQGDDRGTYGVEGAKLMQQIRSLR